MSAIDVAIALLTLNGALLVWTLMSLAATRRAIRRHADDCAVIIARAEREAQRRARSGQPSEGFGPWSLP